MDGNDEVIPEIFLKPLPTGEMAQDKEEDSIHFQDEREPEEEEFDGDLEDFDEPEENFDDDEEDIFEEYAEEEKSQEGVYEVNSKTQNLI